MSDREITEDQVRNEHLAEVSGRAQWLYLVAVLAGGIASMIGLIALLGATA